MTPQPPAEALRLLPGTMDLTAQQDLENSHQLKLVSHRLQAGITTFSVTAIKDNSNESINIILLKNAAVGKISLGPGQNNGGIIISKDYTKAADGTINYSTDNSTAGKQGGGEVNITKLDGNSVEGTFYAVAYNSAGKEAFVEQGTFKGTIK
jgi:hypothetical protein